MTQRVLYPARLLAAQLARTRIDPTKRIGAEEVEPGWVSPLYRFTDYDIHWVKSGVMQYEFGSRKLRAGAGAFCLLPPDQPFLERNVSPKPVRLRLLYAHFSVAAGARDPLRPLDLPVIFRATDPLGTERRFKGLIAALEAWKKGEPWGALCAKSELLALLTLLLQDGCRCGALRFDSRREGPEWLGAVLDTIDRSLLRPELDVRALAQIAHLSPSHFAHQFRRYAGIAPKHLLRRKRLERACDLLLAPELRSIKEIAAQCGYADRYQLAAQIVVVNFQKPLFSCAEKNGFLTAPAVRIRMCDILA